MTTGSLPSVSVVIPCRNEASFIGPCLDSLLANDYPKDRMEIIVVDGLSDDGTRQVCERYARRYPNIRLLDNPRRTAPAAMNVGIRASEAELIARFDAHSTCERRYLSKCVDAMNETGAANVGGRWIVRPQRDTAMGRAICYVLSHRFGAGNAHYKIGTVGRRWVDTVPFGFYRRRLLIDIGLFNESLVRNQDLELNLRIIRSGGRILLDPDVSIDYFARSGLRQFAKHNFADAYWTFYGASFAHLPMAWRHMVPLACVFAASSLAALSVVSSVFMPVLGVSVAAYGSLCLVFSVDAALRQRSAAALLTVPAAFAVRHIAYGLGSAWGLAHVVRRRIRLLRQRHDRRPMPAIEGP